MGWKSENDDTMKSKVWNSSHIETVVFGYIALKRLKVHCTKVIKMKRICYLDFLNLFHANQLQLTLLVQSQ